MDYIVFHSHCPDGFTAAYIAKSRYPEAELIPRNHGEPIDVEKFRDKDVLCVDINIRGKNDEVSEIAKSYLVLDHHKSEIDIIGKPYAVYDVNRSGAGLAWDYLFGKDSDKAFIATESANWTTGKFYTPRPWYVNFVEDRDLWNWKLEESREVNAFIMTFEYTLEAYNEMSRYTTDEAKEAGRYVLKQVSKYVSEVSKQAQFGTFVFDKIYSVAVINVPYLNTSEVGEFLSKTNDISLGWFERQDGMIQFSLRSQGSVDVSKIAVSFNGGGHRNAAGFQLSIDQGRLLIDQILNRKSLTNPEFRAIISECE